MHTLYRTISNYYFKLSYLQEVRQEAGVVRRRWQWLLRTVPSPRETPRNKVGIGLGCKQHRIHVGSFTRSPFFMWKRCVGILHIEIAHHSKELLWQGVMGEEVKLCGVWGESRVGSGGIVEPRTQGQVLSKQLHVILYPL